MATREKHQSSHGDVFQAMGFAPIEAAKLTARSALVDMISETIEQRGLTLAKAAKVCGAHRSFFDKVLRGQIDAVTIDLLARWLVALGHDVEFRVRPLRPGKEKGELSVLDGAAPLSRQGQDERGRASASRGL